MLIDDAHWFAQRFSLKSNRTQPLPICFGSLTILPLRTGRKPSETASEFPQSATSGLIWFTIAPGVNFCPDLNFPPPAREIISFPFEAADVDNEDLVFKIPLGCSGRRGCRRCLNWRRLLTTVISGCV